VSVTPPVVVVLGSRGPGTGAVVSALEEWLAGRATVLAVLEESPDRLALARRRARRLGWWTVAGQVAFLLLVLPVLRVGSRRRCAEIARSTGLRLGAVDGAVLVGSVNDKGTRCVLRAAQPDVVVVNGTRLITDDVLSEVSVPVINIHAGVTPRYRGVHGGYWALAEGRPDLAGTTVHLVDSGIDTGGILGQATFQPSRQDSFATYPLLHLGCGVPVLLEQVDRVLSGHSPQVVPPLPGAEESKLRTHPTAWGYLAARARRGVR
jgi:folate-dependent phosphoribosylglycinamide formyltransferase PurN